MTGFLSEGDKSSCRVLEALKFGELSLGKAEEERVTKVKARGDESVDKLFCCTSGQITTNEAKVAELVPYGSR